MRRLLLLLVPTLLAADVPLPEAVARTCSRLPAEGGLVHLRCGETRLLVVQPQDLDDGPVHDEILESLLDLVPGRPRRAEVEVGDEDLRRTRVDQDRRDVDKGELTVRLVLTSRTTTGRSAACLFGLDGTRRTARDEMAWCEAMTAALLPPPPTDSPTTIEVIEPDLPDEGLDRR